MDVNFYALRAHALILNGREAIESAYDRHSEVNAFWCFVDLKSSSAYRIARGPKRGYVRGELFFSVVKTILAPAEGVRLIKEIGDAVLLSCRDFTPLLESVLLMEQVAYQMASAPDDPEFPFGIRVGISNGPAKKLLRESEDFLGRPIDELARIMAVRSSRSNILIHESVYRVAKDLLSEYGSFLSVGDAEMVPSDIAKGAREPIWYRELLIDRVAMGHHRDGFSSWREVKS